MSVVPRGRIDEDGVIKIVAAFSIEGIPITDKVSIDKDLKLDSLDCAELLLDIGDYCGEDISAELVKDVKTIGDIRKLVRKINESRLA